MGKQKVADIIKSGFAEIKPESGFYVWWFPQEEANALIEPLKEFIDADKLRKVQVEQIDSKIYYALYFGIASKKGGLLQRIKWHMAKINRHTKSCVKNKTVSTLRQTICGVKHWKMYDDNFETSGKVDDILKKCYWEWHSHTNPKEVEKKVLDPKYNKDVCYLLNIQENKTITPECKKALIELRKEARKIED